MTKKFISLLMLVVMVVGVLPVMSVSAESAVDRYDTFETYTVKEFNTNYDAPSTLLTIYDTGDKNNYTQKMSIGKYLSLKIVEMPGLDGEMTNAAQITIKSSGETSQTPGVLRFLGSKIYGAGDIYVQEFDVYITDNPNSKELLIYPIMIKENMIGFGEALDKRTYKEVTPGWHRVKAVTIIKDATKNIIGYVDGEVVSYKNYSMTKPYKYFQLQNYEKGNKTIIIDNLKFWSNPDATTASSVYSNIENVSVNANPTVEFSQEVIAETRNDKLITAANVVMTKSDGTPVEVANVNVGADAKSIAVEPAASLEKGMKYNVKVTGVEDIYGQTVEDYEFSFTTVEESKISCAQPSFTKENLFAFGNQGTTISALTNGYISADLIISNRDVAEKEVCVIAVLKENGTIKSFQFENITVPATGSEDYTCGFQVDDAENQTIETYVWDSFSGKTPLASKWTFTNSGCTETVIDNQ